MWPYAAAEKARDHCGKRRNMPEAKSDHRNKKLISLEPKRNHFVNSERIFEPISFPLSYRRQSEKTNTTLQPFKKIILCPKKLTARIRKERKPWAALAFDVETCFHLTLWLYDVGESMNVRPTNNKKPNLKNKCTILWPSAPILQNPC